MSTILDALRKLEEERHSRTADARSRLLLSPPHQVHLRQRRRSPWKTRRNLFNVIGFLAAGFVGGASLVFWRSHTEHTSPPTAIASSVVKANANSQKVSLNQKIVGEKQAPTRTDRAGENGKELAQEATPHKQETLAATLSPADIQQRSSSTPTPVETVSQTSSPEQSNSASPLAALEVSTPLSPSLPGAQDSAPANISAVQHSPFAAAPPAPREPNPTRREVKQMAKREPVSPPSAPDTPQEGGSSYKVLLPNGATRTVTSPTQPPTTETTSSTSAGTSVSFLQWSSDPNRRIAFLRINGGPLTMAHEGDTVEGYTVVKISQNAVELQSGKTRMTLRP